MYKDFDDFEDEHEDLRLGQLEHFGVELYGDDFYHLSYAQLIEKEGFVPSDSPIDLKSFDVKVAKHIFHGLGDLGHFKDFNNADRVDASYQPNNQTILDAASMPDIPVNPSEFVKKVCHELESKEVFISKEMPDLFHRMCRLFNFSLVAEGELQKHIKSLVFPAQTGIGKSVSVQVYVSMLKSHSSIVVVSKVEDAVAYCKYINALSGDAGYARCYYALTDENKSDAMRVETSALKDYRCIVITHSMFRRVNGFQKVDSFKLYKGKVRQFVSIDEKINFYEQYKLSYRALDQLIKNVEQSIKCCDELNELPTSNEVLILLNEFKRFLLVKDDKIITDSKSIVINYSPVDIDNELNQLNEKLVFSDNSEEFPKKIVGLKNKDAVLKKLGELGVSIQSRRRQIIGVSFKDISKLGEVKNIPEYFCERADSISGNCELKAEENEDHKNKMTYGHKDFDRAYRKKYLYSQIAQRSLDEKKGFNYEDNLKLTATLTKVMLETWLNSLFNSLEALGAKKTQVPS